MSGLKLFCSSQGSGPVRYGLYASKSEAMQGLGWDARFPDPDELRHYWMAEKLYELTTDEVQAKLGVSRQAVSNWRKKAGADLPRLSDARREDRHARIRAALSTTRTAKEIATELGTTPAEVKMIAEQQGVTLLDKSRKKPDDDEIVRLAVGRTWRELAEVCNVSLYTLRNYVYADPDLREKVCGNLVSEPMGQPTHGRIDVDELIRMYGEGLSTFKIAAHFGTQPMSVIYWLKKLGIYRGANDKAEGAAGL